MELVMLRDRYAAALDEIEMRLKSIAMDAASVTEDGQLQMARLTNDMTGPLAVTAIGEMPRPGLDINWAKLPEGDLQAFAGLAGDGSPLADLFAAIPGATRDQMERVLVDGIALGLDPLTVARKMRHIATAMPAYRAETIARTEMIRASREASRRVYEDNPAVTGYVRMATQDVRVCPGCLALSGTYHKTNEIMPSHPNCRCVMIPKTLSWAEITGDASLPDTRPSIPDADGLFAGLSDAEKRIVLGPSRYEAWQTGTPLRDMAEVTQDAAWGPSVRVRPVSRL
jgi:SPP1 gp7 family putative phage head morphogenesis protein